MSLVIRIPLPVEQMTALAGYFTDGPNFMALYGLVSQLEKDADFRAHRFGLVLEQYASTVRNGEFVMTSFDVVEPAKQSKGVRSMLGFRYAEMVASLYLETAEFDELDDQQRLVKDLVAAVNRARVQGGLITEYIRSDPAERWGIKCQRVDDAEDLLGFILKHEKAISKVYLSHHLPQALDGPALLAAYAEALSNKDTLLVCNGYRQIGQVVDCYQEPQRLADGVFTLAQALPLYRLKKASLAERAQLLDRFFWSFDAAEYAQNPHHFFLR